MIKDTSELRKLLENIAAEHNYENCNIDIRSTSTEAASYTGDLYHATITADGQTELKLFVKVANLNRELREDSPISRSFDSEIYFYEHIAKAFENLQNKHCVPDEHKFKTPKYYGCKTTLYDEIIVLENLVAKGYMSWDRHVSVTWEYAAETIDQLAKFHALSFAYMHENQKALEEINRRFSEPIISGKLMKETFIMPSIKEARSLVREENKQRVNDYFESGDRAEEGVACCRPITKTVLAHSDYKTSNLLHRYHEGKLQVIPVDFQTIVAGCPVADLLNFIYSSTDRQFREQHYHRLLERYYTELRQSLLRLDVHPDTVYSRENYNEDLEALKTFGVFVAVTILKVVTVDSAAAPSISQGTTLSEFRIAPSALYQQRLNEVVDEFVERGLL